MAARPSVTVESVARALRDSTVRKRRPLRAFGIYVDADDLLAATKLWADGAVIDAASTDACIQGIGGQVLSPFLWRRRRQYFLPEAVYRRLRSAEGGERRRPTD